MRNLPSASVFEVEDTSDGLRITIPKPKRKLGDIGGLAFLCFWLCGWTLGEISTAQEVWELIQRHEFHAGFWFLAAWLGGWTIGGVLAIKAVYGLAKAKPAETITLGTSRLTHQKGSSNTYHKNDVDTVHLETSGGVHCLYIDSGAVRIHLGEHLREPEREWLYDTIKEWKET